MASRLCKKCSAQREHAPNRSLYTFVITIQRAGRPPNIDKHALSHSIVERKTLPSQPASEADPDLFFGRGHTSETLLVQVSCPRHAVT